MSKIVRFLWCKNCEWSVTIPDGACVNRCQQCNKKGLSILEFPLDEWRALDRWFRERYGVED